MAALGLCCCTKAFPGAASEVYSVEVPGPRTAEASLVARGLWNLGSAAVATWAWLSCGMRDLPGPGIKLVSPVFVGRFFITEPPAKARGCLLFNVLIEIETSAYLFILFCIMYLFSR